MIWRNLQASDIPGACGLNRLAGWNQTEADWSGYLSFEPAGCFAVEIDGMLAGTATTVRYGGALGWIGMVLVHPDHRRHGLGSALLRRTIDYLQGRGTAGIKLDATPMGRKVYVPLGFHDEYEVTRWEGTAPVRLSSGPAALAAAEGSVSGCRTDPFAPGIDGGVLERVADLDEAAFGVRRLGVLAALGTRTPGLCFVANDARGVAGYLIAREGREAIQLGPWVARDRPIAEALWEAFCRAAPDRRVFLDIPGPNASGAALLAPFGFKVQRSFMRMFLGQPGPRGMLEMIYGTSGAEKG